MVTSAKSALIKGGVVQGRLKPGAVYQDGKKWQHFCDTTILIKKIEWFFLTKLSNMGTADLVKAVSVVPL